MARQPLILLIPADRRTGALTRIGLEGYGYDVLVAGTADEALDLLHANQRISVLVVDVKPEKDSDGIALAQMADGFLLFESTSARRGHRTDLEPTLSR